MTEEQETYISELEVELKDTAESLEALEEYIEASLEQLQDYVDKIDDLEARVDILLENNRKLRFALGIYGSDHKVDPEEGHQECIRFDL